MFRQKKVTVVAIVILAVMGIAAVTVCICSSMTTIIVISPSTKAVTPGETFTVDILVTPNQPLKGINLDLKIDPSLITVNSVANGGMFTGSCFGSNNIGDGTVTIFGVAALGGAISRPGTFAMVYMTANSEHTGTTTLHFSRVSVEGQEGEVRSAVTDGLVTVRQPAVFDTGYGSYPSIAGTHTGTITPNRDIMVYMLYTYPCPGTGGHTASVIIKDNTNITGDWHGYKGDWDGIRFSPQFVLLTGHTYHYRICTGSYPQIIHNHTLGNEYGIINCTRFIDVNGRSYNDWIPAFRLEGTFI
ncbi:MAG: cohesin domain-containing protein [Halobacteriota archaeon]